MNNWVRAGFLVIGVVPAVVFVVDVEMVKNTPYRCTPVIREQFQGASCEPANAACRGTEIFYY